MNIILYDTSKGDAIGPRLAGLQACSGIETREIGLNERREGGNFSPF